MADLDGAKHSLRRRNFWVNELQVDEAITGSAGVDLNGNVAVAGSVNLTGNVAITGSANLTGSTTITNLTVGSASINYNYLSYADGIGQYTNSFKAEAIISGGMWVTGSAASGATPSVVLKPATVNSVAPLGICIATAQSGAAATVLLNGFYKGIVAEATIASEQPICMGSGAKLQAALPATLANSERGKCIMGAESGGTISVYLW